MTDWKIGDLALCVDDGPAKIICGMLEMDEKYIANLKVGAIYTITHIMKGRMTGCLGLGDITKMAGGISTRFVKVTPPEADEFDREVIDILIGEPVA